MVVFGTIYANMLLIALDVWSGGFTLLLSRAVRMEKTDSEESIQALRNLVLLVGSLSTCGFVELKPNAKADCLYQMPGFTVPQPSGSGQFVAAVFL